MTIPDETDERLKNLEEKFLYQEETIDALNDVLLEHQVQLATLAEEINRLKTMLTSMEVGTPEGHEPPPPHY